jgi:hypothetical protein
MNPPDTPRVDLLRQWVHKAQKDYDLAQHLLEEGSVYREAIAFNAHNRIEKLAENAGYSIQGSTSGSMDSFLAEHLHRSRTVQPSTTKLFWARVIADKT